MTSPPLYKKVYWYWTDKKEPTWALLSHNFSQEEAHLSFLENFELYMQGKLDVETAAALKSFSTDMQMKVADNLLQLFGGYGYMSEYPISRFFVDARIQRIYGGTNEIMKEIVARSLLGR